MAVNKPNADHSVKFSSENVFSEDFGHLLHIFPAEMWKLISNKPVIGPSDLENLAMSSPFFHNLLLDQRTTYLFGKVFPLVTFSVWKHKGLEGFPVSDVLKCRGVCGHWNDVIDKWIPEEFQDREEESEDTDISPIHMPFRSMLSNQKFTNSADSSDLDKTVQQLLKHFEHSHPGNQPNGRNPMIWNTLEVNITEPDNGYESYLDDISSTLSKYGSHIHYFSVEYDRGDFFENPSKLREWLLCTPNLKELKFVWEDSWNVDIHSCSYESIDTFPKLKYLEKLEVVGSRELVLDQLLYQNPQISTLILANWNPDNNIFRFPLPNLKKLEMLFAKARVIELLGSSQIQWPVESLNFGYTSGRNPDLVGCSTLFQVVQDKFAATLVSLDLFVSFYPNKNRKLCRQIWNDCKTCRLDLPNLKKIKINMNQVILCLDFLLPMKHNLEDISIWLEYDCTKVPRTTLDSGSIVQFVGFEGNMLDANIWTIFKKLMKIEVKAKWGGRKLKSRFYSREDWILNNTVA